MLRFIREGDPIPMGFSVKTPRRDPFWRRRGIAFYWLIPVDGGLICLQWRWRFRCRPHWLRTHRFQTWEQLMQHAEDSWLAEARRRIV